MLCEGWWMGRGFGGGLRLVLVVLVVVVVAVVVQPLRVRELLRGWTWFIGWSFARKRIEDMRMVLARNS
jgi:hypothetical protein